MRFGFVVGQPMREQALRTRPRRRGPPSDRGTWHEAADGAAMESFLSSLEAGRIARRICRALWTFSAQAADETPCVVACGSDDANFLDSRGEDRIVERPVDMALDLLRPFQHPVRVEEIRDPLLCRDHLVVDRHRAGPRGLHDVHAHLGGNPVCSD